MNSNGAIRVSKAKVIEIFESQMIFIEKLISDPGNIPSIALWSLASPRINDIIHVPGSPEHEEFRTYLRKLHLKEIRWTDSPIVIDDNRLALHGIRKLVNAFIQKIQHSDQQEYFTNEESFLNPNKVVGEFSKNQALLKAKAAELES